MRFKSVSFGIGSVISFIIAYFIYLYSSDKGWKLLAFLAKAYLIVYIVIFLLAVGSALLVILASFLLFRRRKSGFKVHSSGAKPGPQKQKEYIDAEYEVKE